MLDKKIVFNPWLDSNDDELACIDKRPDEIRKKAYLLNEGVKCTDWFPDSPEFPLDEEAGMVLADAIPNHVLFKIVSGPLKNLIEENASCDLEFLDVSIRDHRGQLVEEPYYILNILEVVSCVDHDKSDYEVSSFDDTKVHSFRHLYLDTDKIPKNANLFRLGEKTNLIIIRQNLSDILVDAGMTGLNFVKLEDYGKQYR